MSYKMEFYECIVRQVLALTGESVLPVTHYNIHFKVIETSEAQSIVNTLYFCLINPLKYCHSCLHALLWAPLG